MSVLATDEIRLLFAVLLNALVLGASWRLARRFNSDDRLRAAGDAGLLYYLVQYVSVCATGLAGAMHALTIALVAILASSAMAAVGGGRRPRPVAPEVDAGASSRAPEARKRLAVVASKPTRESRATAWLRVRGDRALVVGALGVVIGYLAMLVWHQRLLPVISNDALTYHLPAAAQWLQTGRLTFYEAWFYNPANSYSPLAGSAFLAWLMAPIGNDAIARFVQVGPALLLMIAMLNLCRAFGASAGVAALIAAACVLARPFASQTILAKDDLFVAAFFILLIDALRRERLAEPFGPWRVGLALGLLLATKFTVLFSLPILLLMWHRGWTWWRVAIAAVVVFVLAGPWYLRNLSVTGNPLYPTSVKAFGVTLLPGMLDVGRSNLLKTPRGAWAVFTAGYYGIPDRLGFEAFEARFKVGLAQLLVIGWISAWIVSKRDAIFDALKRTCLIGPLIGVALFVAAAPYGEMRFAYPSVALLFAAGAIALARLPLPAQWTLAGSVLLLASLTAFRIERSGMFTVAGVMTGAIGAGVALIRLRRPAVVTGGGAMALLAGMVVYVNWQAYIRQLRDDAPLIWADPGVYGPVGDVWGYVRRELPEGATVAYANTYFTYPLMGFAYDHRVVHAPTRRGLERFVDMPRNPTRLTGEQITGHVVAMLREDPDRDAWLRRLRETGAAYLVVMKQDPASPDRTVTPPELTFAAQDPDRFMPVFENEAGVVYRMN